ncbi:hypothetical protein ACFFX1_33945 [Dactylosporangium sucinum]|uniref:MarR family transcriptional regulator n=1 Tax=Dactylosporangium sucinum TaxID=1424081 RepID=A0A917UFG5_9ACTN|nr:MarR family transcriptional regulator [Dactylosporangium sucinum]GGM80302.1 hypothetical protein GCM10007977_097230 [Dactylosporangium sucinum]
MSSEFTTAVIGQTEKALNAILDRLLAGRSLTEPQWVALTLTVMGGDARRIAGALKVDEAAARQRLAELAEGGLVRLDAAGAATATEAGRARWSEVRAEIGPITERLWGDLPKADLDVTGRVLGTILDRANQYLARPEL